MPDITYRPIGREELPAFREANGTAFGFTPGRDDGEDVWGSLEFERTLAALDGDQFVGTSASLSMQLTVPGGQLLPAAGVTVVGVRPTHRRQRILTGMMGRLLDDAQSRGEAVAILWASESLIYGRFGYGQTAPDESFEIEREHAAIARRPGSDGRVRMLDRAAAERLLPDVWERARTGRPGTTVRDERFWRERFEDRPWDRSGASGYFFAAHEEESGTADGYAIYRIKSKWEGYPQSEVTVVELIAATDAALADLWAYLLDLDLTSSVQAHHRPIDDPLPWMLADMRRLRRRTSDGLWLRVLDVPAALEARTYGTDGQLAFELRDAFRPDNAGSYELRVAEGRGEATRMDAPPDLALDVADLGAIYLGGVRPSVLARAGRIEERTPGALSRADALFATERAPWCPQFF